MKIFLLNILLLFSLQLPAQKRTQEIIDAANLQYIEFDGDEVYRIIVRTAPVDHITISTRTDGEYYNDIGLETEVKQHTLLLKSKFQNRLRSGFDKLSAHKVLSMEVELQIPERMDLEIVSNVALVYLSGIYDAVLLQVKNGSCSMESFVGDAVVNTITGNIYLETTNAEVKAQTRHGNLQITPGMFGENLISLTSISGNIQVQETK